MLSAIGRFSSALKAAATAGAKPFSGATSTSSPASQTDDARCERSQVTPVCGMAESLFVDTHARSGKSVTAIGAEVIEFAGGKIKALRDYHRLTAPRSAQ